MAQGYFTDREQGARPRSVGVIDNRVWGGLYVLISARLNDESFGYVVTTGKTPVLDPVEARVARQHRHLDAGGAARPRLDRDHGLTRP